jgi:predicted RNase H-like nuclease (RuvC/YqgF family)
MATLEKIDELRADNAQLAKRASDLSADLTRARRELKGVQTAEEKAAQAEERAETAETENKALKAELARARAEVDTLHKQIAADRHFVNAATKLREGFRALG